MQYPGRHSFSRFAVLSSLVPATLFLYGCSGSVGNPGSGGGGDDGEGGGGGNMVPPGPPPVASECSARTGRPARQLSTNTAFQTATVVEQVFGPEALKDPQVKSMLADLPRAMKAKGFDTETHAISGQFVTGYMSLVGRLAGLAADQAPIRKALESFAGQDCGGTTDLAAGCGAEFARKFADALVREPMVQADFGYIMETYNVTKGKYQAPKAYAAFVASVLASAKSAMRFDNAEFDAKGTVDAATIGSRMAMTLTSGLPDATLRAKIADGSILDIDVRKEESKRLMNTPAGRATLAHFADQWLNLAELKSPPGKAGYVATREESNAVALAAREEIGKLFEKAVTSGGQLIDFYGTTEVRPSHDWLAKIYGTAKGTNLTAAGAARTGILSRAAFNLYGDFGEYIPLAHRGYAIKVTMLCGSIPPLPDNVDTTLPATAPDVMSSRQYFETLTQVGACNECHKIMNPYGFALSDFSVTGERLVMEKVKNRKTNALVDVGLNSEVSVMMDGSMRDVTDAASISKTLGESDQARACFAHRYDQFAVGQKEDFLCDEEGMENLPKNNLSLEDTIAAYVASSAFSAR